MPLLSYWNSLSWIHLKRPAFPSLRLRNLPSATYPWSGPLSLEQPCHVSRHQWNVTNRSDTLNTPLLSNCYENLLRERVLEATCGVPRTSERRGSWGHIFYWTDVCWLKTQAFELRRTRPAEALCVARKLLSSTNRSWSNKGNYLTHLLSIILGPTWL